MDCMMYKAAREGNVEFLKQSIQSGSNLLLHTQQENNIIHIAAKLGHESFILEALQTSPFLASHKNSQGDTPLHVAARAGHVGVVKLLLNNNSSLFKVDLIETPSTKVLREMEEGVSGVPKLWRMKNMVQSTALHEALRNGHDQVAKHLWELDPEMAGLVTCAGESPLYLAAESSCKEALRGILKFLKANSDRVNLLRDVVRGPDGQNPLHAAVLSGNSECIDCLLEEEEISKLIINQPDISGKTALHFATTAGKTQIMHQLLNKSTSSAYLRDTNGRTPLLEAACSGNFYVLQQIIQHCPDTIEICDTAGRNALHLAVLNNTVPNVRDFLFLPEMKELVNEPDEEGNTSLHLAIKNENYKMVRKLMATRCVDLRAKNNRGLTALDICESDWKLSYRQSSVHSFLSRQNAPTGRHPYNLKRYRKSKNALYHPDADLKQMANTMSVVAALLATLTFAAAFTLPGGYHAEDNHGPGKKHRDKDKDVLGASILIWRPSLQLFLLADSLAMCCSMTVVFLLILAMSGDPAYLRSAIIYSKNLLNIALLGTLVAFVTGLYAVVSPKSEWLAIIVIIMGCSVPVLIKFLSKKSSTTTPLVIKLLKGTMTNPVLSFSPGRKLETRANLSTGYSQVTP